ncbi:hypothetical protein ABZ215_30035 [Amycolatopsis sp. NPDC006131]|uniref:hypothetical protein n=1 Tax=Amycolatopsis sp. NPDC006131 TaxID=3156731 RepID=UPI0033AC6A72
MSPSTVNHSREFRPLRWLGWALVGCAVSFVIGLAAAESATPPADSPVTCAP